MVHEVLFFFRSERRLLQAMVTNVDGKVATTNSLLTDVALYLKHEKDYAEAACAQSYRWSRLDFSQRYEILTPETVYARRNTMKLFLHFPTHQSHSYLEFVENISYNMACHPQISGINNRRSTAWTLSQFSYTTITKGVLACRMRLRIY
jgi:hypothetical protein